MILETMAINSHGLLGKRARRMSVFFFAPAGKLGKLAGVLPGSRGKPCPRERSAKQAGSSGTAALDARVLWPASGACGRINERSFCYGERAMPGKSKQSLRWSLKSRAILQKLYCAAEGQTLRSGRRKSSQSSGVKVSCPPRSKITQTPFCPSFSKAS